MLDPQAALPPHLRPTVRPQADPRNLLLGEGLRVTVLSPRLFRVELECWTDEATQAIWYRDFPPTPFTWEDTGDRLTVQTEAVTLCLDKKDFSRSYVRLPEGTQVPLDNRENLRGTCSTLDTNGRQLREHPEVTQFDREHIPLDMGVCAKNGVAVYEDTQSLLLYPDGRLAPRAGGRDLYVFAFGRDYPAAVRALYRLCGSTPVLPRWALGNWWSHYWAYTQQSYLDLMDNFAEDGIPISVAVIDMDWHYVDLDRDFSLREKGLAGEEYGGTDGWTGYTWNEKLFPDPPALLKTLGDRGIHRTLNLHPALGVRWFEKPYRAMAESLGMDPAEKRPIPFRIASPGFVERYFRYLHHPLEEEGVDFWWVDWQQGNTSEQAGLDPLWALNHYHYLDNAHRKGEGLILSRYAGVGSHRYPVGFSGDTHMDWEFLDYMPYFTATAANVGYGWWSHDIGGHHQGLREEELYLRWLEFGVFSPINRIHCGNSPVVGKEPWGYSAPTRAMAEKWLRFRHRLVPYLYSASWKNTQEGEPLIRPMYYGWPDREEAYEADHQYLFGELLAAPITEKAQALGLGEKKVWLPEGTWTDIFTGGSYAGGRWVTVYRDSGSIPVFAREGTVLPLDPVTENACALPDRLDLWIFSGSGHYRLREGETRGWDITLTREGENVQKVTLSGGDRPMGLRLLFRNVQEGTCALRINGAPVPPETRHNRCFQVLFSLEAGDRAEVTLTEHRQPQDHRERILPAFRWLPLDNRYKNAKWGETRDFCTAGQWLRWVESLDLPAPGKGLLREQLETTRG